jgi:hypothetical protein
VTAGLPGLGLGLDVDATWCTDADRFCPIALATCGCIAANIAVCHCCGCCLPACTPARPPACLPGADQEKRRELLRMIGYKR